MKTGQDLIPLDISKHDLEAVAHRFNRKNLECQSRYLLEIVLAFFQFSDWHELAAATLGNARVEIWLT